LISAEISPGDSDNDGWSALHWASRKGEPDVVQVLLDAGLAPSDELLFNWSPSEVAECHGQLQAFTILQEAQKKPVTCTLEDLFRSEVENKSNVHLVCSQCELPCIFGNVYECKACDSVTLCFKCGRSRVLLHREHEFQVTERNETWTRRTLDPVEFLRYRAGEERQKHRRELKLDT
jgi:hypothetical protein